MKIYKILVWGVAALLIISSSAAPLYSASEDSLAQTSQDSTGSESMGQNSSHVQPIVSDLWIDEIGSEKATIHTEMDQDGQGYFVLLPSDSSAPSASQVRLGQDAAGNAATLNDNGPGASWSDEFPVYNLSPETAYMAYFVLENASGDLSEVQSDAFTTLGTTPNISSLSIGGITQSGATIHTVMDRSWQGYFVLSATGSTVPTADQVRLGQDASGNVASLNDNGPGASGNDEFPVYGLSANTPYILYFTLEDEDGNLSSVKSAAFTTLGTGNTSSGSTGSGSTGSGSTGTGSTWSGSTGSGSTGSGSTGSGDTVAPIISTLSLSGTTTSGATLSATLNESGTGYWVVVPNGSAVPTADQVSKGKDASGSGAFISNSSSMGTGATSFQVNGLTPETTYLLYFTASDMSGNLQQTLRALGIMTH